MTLAMTAATSTALHKHSGNGHASTVNDNGCGHTSGRDDAESLPPFIAAARTRGYKKWRNWARIIYAYPAFYHTPATVEQLRQILTFIHGRREKARIVGCGHSPSDIAACNEHMVDVTGINRLIGIDTERREITVQCGMLISDLINHLDDNGLAMPSLGSIDDQTVGGLLGSGTHGTGTQCFLVSHYVQSLTLLKANGDIVECSRVQNSDLFRACLVNLGCLGVVTEITLQAVPAFDLAQSHTVCDFDFITDENNFLSFVHSSPYPRLHWYPHEDKMIATRMQPCEPNPSQRTKPSIVESLVVDPVKYFLMHYVYQLLLFVAIYVKSLTPIINAAFFRINYPSNEKFALTPSRDGFIFDCLFAQHVDEWTIPRSKTCQALRSLRSLIKQQGLTCDFPIEVRFMQCDDAILSPARNLGEADVTYIGVISYRPFSRSNPQVRQYFTSFERLMRSLGGRAHWAKNFHLSADDLRLMYGKDYDRFDQLRRVCDDRNVFVNDYVQRVFKVSE